MGKCKICNNKNENKPFQVREMQFGTKETFDYYQCSECGCVQIEKIPEDIAKYYPDNYGAFSEHRKIKDSGFVAYLRNKKLEHNLRIKRSLIGALFTLVYGEGFEQKLRPAKLKPDSTILDVGTGTGGRIITLRKKGFKHLSGVDPFIKEDIHYANGVSILKKHILDVHEKYDFIMLNHSFEHMPNPREVLNKLNQLLEVNHYVMIRIPVSDSWSFKHYGVNWVALDAPRHFFVHTVKSMEFLAKMNGFEMDHVLHDSSMYQFVASEQFAKDISLMDERSYYNNPGKSIFSEEQIKEFKKRANQLNKNKEGDAACFYLKKVKDV